ncbi:MAG: DNA polymerase I [Candidatus Melainabacteria bacterium]|nr:DNA polymerase I [Candidatus Melainabacteria bacterium]
MKTLVLIDGHALAYRMHFALERTGMSTKAGLPTWAVYGFYNAIFHLLKEVRPDALAVAFDVARETFRNEWYSDYKAHRAEMPDSLRQQLGLIREGVDRLGIPVFEVGGYEADDVIGTLCQQLYTQYPDWQVRILTGDQDAFQLVSDDGRIQVLIPPRTPKDPLKHYDRAAVFEKLGAYPEQVTDFKGLKGDTSDNIPGVPGIGDKTAAKLLAEFSTLESIYQQLEQVSPVKLKEKLLQYREQAELSKRLATIHRAVPEVQLDIEHCYLHIPDRTALLNFLERLEFRSFVNQANGLLAAFSSAEGAESALPSNEGGTEPKHSNGIEPDADSPASSLPETAPHVGVEHTAEGYLKVPHTIITQMDALQRWAERIRAAGVFAIDVETTSLNVRDAQPVGIALAIGNGLKAHNRPLENPLHLADLPPSTVALLAPAPQKPEENAVLEAAYIPVGHQDPQCQEFLSFEAVMSVLNLLLQDETLLKVVHNGKYELNVFRQWGYPWHGPLYDTLVASYAIQSERRHGLKALAQEVFGYRMVEYETVVGTGKQTKTFDQVPVEQAAIYAAADAFVTLALAQHFSQQMTPTQSTLFYEVELPLVPVLAAMEWTGVCLNTEHLSGLSETLATQMTLLEKDIWSLAGVEFNLNSPKQVGEILFERMGIQPLRKTASKTAYSTDAKVLEKLAPDYPIVQRLLDYRQLFKLKSTYVDSLPTLIHPSSGRVHTHFNQVVTATGRLSSSEPNLQNIPVRTELGRSIRQAFVPNGTGNSLLLSADYSQIELRLLAHFSEDPHLVDAFQQGLDVHTATAALVFGLKPEQVSKEQRYRAKAVNFGIIYGQTAHGLSQQLNIPRHEAQLFIDRYFRTYARVQHYIEEVKAQAHRDGGVYTLLGRWRNLKQGLESSVRGIREFSERAAFNTPLQGSAADLMKLAMIRLAHKLEAERLPSRMILQVHDEIVLEVPEAEMEATQHWVNWAMQLDQPLRVPLVVDMSTGPTWLET